MPLPIGLQLYTVRDELAKDPDAALGQVAALGYEHVELAGLHGLTPAGFRDLLDKHGLKAIASHEPLDDPDEAAERAEVLGHQFVVCPYLDESQRQSYGPVRDKLLEAQGQLQGHGLTVCYHNHDFEWQPADGGERAMDILFDGTALNSELDVYWAARAGDDPVDWINKLAGRLPLLHIKDMAETADRGFAEVGTGVLDFGAILPAAERAGVRYLIVEQDSNWATSPMESARVGLENLRSLLG